MSAAVVIGFGVLALLNDSVLRRGVDSLVDIHLLFGALLVGFMVVQFYRTMTPQVISAQHEMHDCYRHLKRTVYLLLYCIIAIRQLIGFVTSYCRGQVFDFELAGFHPSKNLHYLGFNAHNDGHFFMASGILALCVIRLLMFSISTVGTEKKRTVPLFS